MEETQQSIFVSSQQWLGERPRILVVACSDGRYQVCLDEFLHHHLGIDHYDRLYAPGGPGALASSTLSFFRGEQFRQEAMFLIEAHLLDEIILIFHGPALPDGPKEATCADYQRKMPYARSEEINRQQEADLKEALKTVFKCENDVRLRVYRAEVRTDGRVQFVPLTLPSEQGY